VQAGGKNAKHAGVRKRFFRTGYMSDDAARKSAGFSLAHD